MDLITFVRSLSQNSQRPLNDREVVRQTTAELKELQEVVTMLLESLGEMKDSLTEAIDLAEQVQ